MIDRAEYEVMYRAEDAYCDMGVDELSALREFQRILKPGGLVVLRLPAYTWLRGRHDEATRIRSRPTQSRVSRHPVCRISAHSIGRSAF